MTGRGKETDQGAGGDQGQATTNVRQALDKFKLAEWIVMEANTSDTLLPIRNCPPNAHALARRIEVRQFGFGQSNPTYLLRIDKGALELVLRKKPDHIAHASAHALHREFRVLQALKAHNGRHPEALVPIPTPYAYCKDKRVLGAEFYLMEYVSGRIFTDPAMPGISRDERHMAYNSVVSTLANLHAVDFLNS